MATVTYINPPRKPRIVKNLGYILKAWKHIKEFGWFDVPANSQYFDRWQGYFCAIFDDGRMFITNFANYSVCIRFLNRPVFRGLPFNISKNGNTKIHTVTIGEYEDNVRFV